MPIIGEIVHGNEIGRFQDKIYIWTACTKCGGERWAECRNGKPFYSICFKCSRPKKKVWELITTKPYLGEIRRSDQIEGYAKIKTKYIYEECPNCHNQKWVQVSSKGKYPKCRQCMNRGKTGEKSGTWKGGRKINYAGYIMVRLYPDNPYYAMANTAGYVFEHRLVMAQYLCRCLEDWEMVHHRDSIKTHNTPENLFVTDAKNHNILVEATLVNQGKHIKAQDNRIEGLESRVTLLEAENTLLKADMSEYV
jgi:hypothetical protein